MTTQTTDFAAAVRSMPGSGLRLLLLRAMAQERPRWVYFTGLNYKHRSSVVGHLKAAGLDLESAWIANVEPSSVSHVRIVNRSALRRLDLPPTPPRAKVHRIAEDFWTGLEAWLASSASPMTWGERTVLETLGFEIPEVPRR